MVEWTADPEAPTAEAPASSSPRGPVGKERRLSATLALLVVTFGFYAIWYHWVTHRELCDYIGRPVHEKSIWAAYVCSFVLAVAFVVLIVVNRTGMVLAGATAVTEPALVLLLLVDLIVMWVLFLLYMRKQYKVVAEAKRRMGLTNEAVVTRFILLPGVLSYWDLHIHYQEIWRHARALRGPMG